MDFPRLARWLVCAGVLAVAVPPAAIARSSQPAAPAQAVPAGQRVARNAAEVPADWIAAHPEGGCMTNPFASECGAPGHPITVAYYPPASQLAAQLNPTPATPAESVVTIPGGPSLAVATSDTAPASAGSAKAHASQSFTCLLTVYAPARSNQGGNIFMFSQTQISACPVGVIEATATATLYQRTVFVATGSDPAFGSPPFSLASAWYDCGHSNVITYTNQGSGYIETASGTAGFNSANKSANHSCT